MSTMLQRTWQKPQQEGELTMTDREKLIELLDGVLTTEDVTASEKVADHLIANGVTIQKWIPVTERLPEVETPVLTYRETGQNVELLWQRGCQKRWDYDEFTPCPVTHWMPLPEPPKEVE
jgi:hypothetical protein